MQPPTQASNIQYFPSFLTPSRQYLIQYGFRDVFAGINGVFQSPVSKIKYSFHRMEGVVNNQKMVFSPLFVQIGSQFAELYIQSNRTEQNTPSEAERLVDAYLPTKQIAIDGKISELRIFPNDPAFRQRYPGFNELVDQGFMFIGPRWCVGALGSIETNGKEKKIETLILPDNIPEENYVREARVFPEILGSGMRGQPLDQRVAQFLQVGPITPLMLYERNYLADVVYNLLPGAQYKLIGRPICLNFIDRFIVHDNVVPAVGMVVGKPPSNFTPAPSNKSAPGNSTYVPAGFIGYNPTGTIQTAVTIQLSSEIKNRINNFMVNSGCGKATSRRHVQLAKKILKESTIGFQNLSDGGHLNVSSCRHGATDNKGFTKRTMGIIPGTNHPLNLAITRDDLASLISGNAGIPVNEETEKPTIDAVFMEIQNIIFLELGKQGVLPADKPSNLTAKILATIPSGSSPVGRLLVQPINPFVQNVTLAGVTEKTTPIIDGKRCIEGLGAKKRG